MQYLKLPSHLVLILLITLYYTITVFQLCHFYITILSTEFYVVLYTKTTVVIIR